MSELDDDTLLEIENQASDEWREWERGLRPTEIVKENNFHYWTAKVAYQRGLAKGREERSGRDRTHSVSCCWSFGYGHYECALARIRELTIPVSERFFSYVDIPSDPTACWIWKGSTRGDSRAALHHNGKVRPASQISWELANGKPFPPGLMACHTCDDGLCVNPDHIWPGTMSENIKDAVIKKRHAPVAPPHLPYLICKRGHAMEGENVGYFRNGNKFCRACKQAADQRNWMLRKARRAALRAEPAPPAGGEQGDQT